MVPDNIKHMWIVLSRTRDWLGMRSVLFADAANDCIAGSVR